MGVALRQRACGRRAKPGWRSEEPPSGILAWTPKCERPAKQGDRSAVVSGYLQLGPSYKKSAALRSVAISAR